MLLPLKANSLRNAEQAQELLTNGVSSTIIIPDESVYGPYYSPTCLKQAAKGNTKTACLRQVLA